MTVRHILQQKGRNLWTIDPNTTVFDALAKMAEKDVGSLVVMDREKLIGIITERHYSRNVILKGKTSPTTLLRDIMERNVVHVRPDHSVELCMTLMTERRVRHLPVLEGDCLARPGGSFGRATGGLKGVTVERSEASIVRIIEGSNP